MPPQTSAPSNSSLGKGNSREATLKNALETLTDPLNAAIDTISEQRLRHVLKLLCGISPETRSLAAQRLLIDEVNGPESESPEEEENEENNSDNNNNDNHEDVQLAVRETPAPSHLKRQISRYAMCENCERSLT
ncbi:hypothetical protein BJX65DRAFT_290430 [Aspergillus insuetus]